MRPLLVCLLALFLAATTLTCSAQQTDIREFAAYYAYSYLNTGSLNLVQRGFDADVGYNVRPWLTFGFDFSRFTGHSSILPGYLNAPTQAHLAPFLGLLPPGYVLTVPYNSTTSTFEAGPQINYRRVKKLTLFVRPALGALHANFDAKPNPLVAPIVSGLLGGSTSASDTVMFYGFGGGFTWEINPHFGIRVATDFARYNFFSGVLDGSRNSVRLSVGTKFGFGRNILRK
jgi:hypothetical protein